MSLVDTKEQYDILDMSGNPLSSISIGTIFYGITILPSIRLYYSIEGGATPHGGKLTAAGYEYILSPVGEINGKELIEESWLEAKSTGLWTPLNATSGLAITPESQTIQLRLNIPNSAATKGLFRFSLSVLFSPEGIV